MTRRTALAALLLVALAPGCRRPVADAAVSAEPSPGFPVAVTDSFGATLTLPSKPLRVVSLATSNTELVFAVGAGDAVVGVTTFCDYPPAAADREKVGQFMPSTFNLERIVALRPDLVLTTGTVQVPLTESLRRLGLPVLSFDAQDLAGVARNVRAVGTATGHAEAADRLATTLEARAEAVRGRTDAIPVEQRPTVLLLLDDVSMLSAGPKSFPGRLVELAGGRNLFADATQDYPRVSAEQVVRRNPDALLLWHAVTPAGRWADLPAVKNGRVLRIDEDLISRPGPRLFDGLERLADLLHPAKKP